jgi:hypothetical protein
MPPCRIALAALIATTIAPPAFAQASRDGEKRVAEALECRCLAQGRSFGLGETACLRTSEGPRLAECGMVLNNTSWRFTQRPCPES